MLTLGTVLNNVQRGLAARPNEQHVRIPRAGVLLILKDREDNLAQINFKESELKEGTKIIDSQKARIDRLEALIATGMGDQFLAEQKKLREKAIQMAEAKRIAEEQIAQTQN